MLKRCGIAVCLLCVSFSLHAQAPVADMHLHYKWTQQDVTSPAEAIALLDQHNIVMGVVIGTPAQLALQLQALAPARIVPIFSPYREGGDWYRWAYEDATVTRARAALSSGQYRGIGELHVIGGFAPAFDKAIVLKQLLALGNEFDVPVMIHTEFSRPDFMLSVCEAFPDTRIVWAHSGALLEPADVDSVLSRCGNVSGGLGARDPWRIELGNELSVFTKRWQGHRVIRGQEHDHSTQQLHNYKGWRLLAARSRWSRLFFLHLRHRHMDRSVRRIVPHA